MVTSTLKECLHKAKGRLANESASLECQVLLANILKKNRTWLLAHDDDLISKEDQIEFDRQIAQRASGYPVAYLIGSQEFWSLELKVTEATLIPRPDTEILVEEVLRCHPQGPAIILDLGTGSGAIAIALASEHPEDTVIAMDISTAAIQVANQNKHHHNTHNVSYFIGNWSHSIADRSLDMIVSNPPYIANTDSHLEALKYEPLSALTAGSDGLDDYKIIARDAVRCLKSGGTLALEHGYDQQSEVVNILQHYNFDNIRRITDLGGQPRVVMAQAS